MAWRNKLDNRLLDFRDAKLRAIQGLKLFDSSEYQNTCGKRDRLRQQFSAALIPSEKHIVVDTDGEPLTLEDARTRILELKAQLGTSRSVSADEFERIWAKHRRRDGQRRPSEQELRLRIRSLQENIEAAKRQAVASDARTGALFKTNNETLAKLHQECWAAIDSLLVRTGSKSQELLNREQEILGRRNAIVAELARRQSGVGPMLRPERHPALKSRPR